MGGSSDSGPSDSDFGRLSGSDRRDQAMAEATNRAKKQQEEASRQSAFDDYQSQRKAASQGIDEMISPQKASTVRENAGLAMMLDERAKTSQINVPVPTFGTVAMGTISSASARQQARALRGGGRPVYDASSTMFDANKDYRGVVKDGVYSGDPDFNPIGRDDFTRTASGSYSIMGATSDSSDNTSEDVASPQMRDMTTSKPSSPSISTASRRALIAGAGGGAARRNLL
tara:strand:- start:21 stop:707 length:687 start_codon:yes stop_codon:yes gene_type:complete